MSDGIVRFRIFGGLRVWRDDQELDLGSARHRVVLAELLVADGGVVSISELLEALWGEALPSTAVNQLHQIIGHLRRLLEPGLAARATGSWVLGSSGGYRLRLPTGTSFDLARCRELRARALEAAGTVSSAGSDLAMDCYVAALHIARRPAFVGMPTDLLGRPEFVALQAERVGLAVEAARRAIESDRSSEVLQTVDAVAAEVPLHESLQAVVMRLLASSGRRADALGRYERTRRALADDLGIDPSSELQTAYRYLLEPDNGISSRAAMPETPRDVVRPAQLPAAIPGFSGREDALQALDDMYDAAGGTVLVTAVGGMAGIGKTALAVRWAHSVAHRFPDGQLYLNLRGFDPAGQVMSPADAAMFMLTSLGVPFPPGADPDLESRSARLRSAISGRKILILLDNAFDAEQLRPLLPGHPGCLVIATSRNRLAGLVVHEGARPLMLGRLTPGEADQLLADRIGARRVAADPGSAETIARACDGLPLALSIVAARAATSPEIPLADLAASLTSAHPLEALSSGDRTDDIRTAFTWSYTTLSAGAARLFRFAGAHPGQEMSVRSLASMTGMPVSETQRHAAELLAGSLLNEQSRGCFTIHDLLRMYAAELLDAEGERDQAERRLVQHVAVSTRAAFVLYRPNPQTQLDPIDDGIHGERLADFATAVDWYTRDRGVIRTAVDLAVAHGIHRTASLIVLDRRPMAWVSDTPSEALPIARIALDSARRAGDLHLQAQLESDVAGKTYATDVTGSQAKYERALEIYRELGDLVGESITLRALGARIVDAQGDAEQALSYFRDAVDRARQARSHHDLISAQADLALSLYKTRHAQEAVVVAEDLLDLVRTSGQAQREPSVALTLAQALLAVGDDSRAADLAEWGLQQTLGLYSYEEEMGFARVLAVAAFRIGDLGRALSGCRRFRQALGSEEHHAYLEAMGSQFLIEAEQEVDEILDMIAIHTGETPAGLTHDPVAD